MVFYTDRVIPKGFAGITLGFVILIRPSYRDDQGLLEHEKVHVRQFWRNPLMPLLYLMSKKKRLQYEVEAYREQLQHSPDDLNLFASYLSQDYSLGISEQEALTLLINNN